MNSSPIGLAFSVENLDILSHNLIARGVLFKFRGGFVTYLLLKKFWRISHSCERWRNLSRKFYRLWLLLSGCHQLWKPLNAGWTRATRKVRGEICFFCRKEICEAAVSWQNLLCEDLLNFESTCNYHRRVIPGHWLNFSDIYSLVLLLIYS